MEPNELAPTDGVPAQGADTQEEGDESRAYTTSTARRRARLKTPLEIQTATEPVIVLATLGIMKEGIARTLLQALKLQLDCTRAGESEDGSPISGADINALAEVMDKNPKLLEKLAPHMSAEEIRELIQSLGR